MQPQYFEGSDGGMPAMFPQPNRLEWTLPVQHGDLSADTSAGISVPPIATPADMWVPAAHGPIPDLHLWE